MQSTHSGCTWQSLATASFIAVSLIAYPVFQTMPRSPLKRQSGLLMATRLDTSSSLKMKRLKTQTLLLSLSSIIPISMDE